MRYLGPVLVGVFCLLPLGCAAVLLAGAVGAGAAGGVMYAKGDLEATFDLPMSKVVEASRDTIHEAELHLIAEKDLVTSWVFECRRADDAKVTIRVQSLTTETSRLNIRVGVFGDEDYSRLIYGKIRDRLQ